MCDALINVLLKVGDVVIHTFYIYTVHCQYVEIFPERKIALNRIFTLKSNLKISYRRKCQPS